MGGLTVYIVLLMHGGQARPVPCEHSEWLAHICRSARVWHLPDDGRALVSEQRGVGLDAAAGAHQR
jgi:hypothetical protein